MPFLKQQCPEGTTSEPGSTNMLMCTCTKGITCVYSKVVEAIISLNISKSHFQQADVQARFVNAVANAASVTSDKVYLFKIVDKDTGEEVPVTLYNGVRRRALFGALSDDDTVREQHIMVAVKDTENMMNMDHHLVRSGLPSSTEWHWYPRHDVKVF
jgi:hypothetical protein